MHTNSNYKSNSIKKICKMIRYCINMNKTKDNNKTKDMNKNKNITNRSKSSFTVISNKNINNNNLTINN